MAVRTKAPLGQRVGAALIALFCVLAALALFGSHALTSWYRTALAIVALCGVYIFGSITIRGCLPGRFRAGGNAFVGSRQNGGASGAYRSAPVWQRAFCAVLAIGGSAAIVAGLVTGNSLASYRSVASLLLALGGLYLFGYIALRGTLPSARLGGGNAALNHHDRRSGG